MEVAVPTLMMWNYLVFTFTVWEVSDSILSPDAHDSEKEYSWLFSVIASRWYICH